MKKVAFISVVPSPYQRDLFRELASRPELQLEVYYLEAESPDSPWPQRSLADYEKILPGTWFSLGPRRCHLNWNLPKMAAYDVVVMNTLMSLTAQWLMRGALRKVPWFFWGERLMGNGSLYQSIIAPLASARGIAAIGSWAEQDYRRRFPSVPTVNLPYYCDLNAFVAAPKVPRVSEEIVFLFCGQMIARKGIDLLLEAFAQLKSGRLLLAGREAELPERMKALPQDVRSRIEFAGFQPPEKLPQWFARADVFVLPSRHDGWGVVVNQALGAGLPILCSDAAGAGYDLVENEVNGLRFPAGDRRALAVAMQRFIDDPGLVESWGAASRAKASNWFPSVGAQRWVETIQSAFP